MKQELNLRANARLVAFVIALKVYQRTYARLMLLVLLKKTHKKKTVANTVVKKSRTQAKKGKKSLKNKDFY